MTPEDWLIERLKRFGADVYVDETFASMRDRLAHVIVINGLEQVVAGRHDRKIETYSQVFERIYGIKLTQVPRGTVSHTKRSTAEI